MTTMQMVWKANKAGSKIRAFLIIIAEAANTTILAILPVAMPWHTSCLPIHPFELKNGSNQYCCRLLNIISGR
jgi:hypothetical protein